jgi:3',5'-cyclic AMP phosphodiesterase CpdA
MNGKQESIRIVVIADIHFGPDTPNRPGSKVTGLMEKFTGIVNSRIKPDLVLELGDRINNVDPKTDIANLSFLLNILDRKLDAPCYHIMGNHDIHHVDKAEVSRIAGGGLWMTSRQVKGYKFIVLDTVDPVVGEWGGEVGKEQLAWLENELTCDESPKIVLGHHPADDQDLAGRDMDWSGGNNHMHFIENKKDVRRVLEKGKHVIAYLSGHMHWFSFLSVASIAYIVAPSFLVTCPEGAPAPGAFITMTINADGRMDAVVCTVEPCCVLGHYTSGLPANGG